MAEPMYTLDETKPIEKMTLKAPEVHMMKDRVILRNNSMIYNNSNSYQ